MSDQHRNQLDLQEDPRHGLLLHRRSPSKDRSLLQLLQIKLNVTFQQQKSYSDAVDYCARNNMQLVAIETQEEWDLLRRFLTDNLGSTEEYAASFWTSGVDENSDGRWQWTSSKQPLFFRNWGSYYHNKGSNRLIISGEKPFTWFNGRTKNEKRPISEYFICESSALQQEMKHVIAFVNSKDCPQSIGTNSACVYLEPLGCYCFVLTKSNWIEGSRHCKSQGMELVSIETEAEDWQIAAFLLEHQSSYELGFGTSALYNEEKSQWVWTATGQSVDYANWDDGQPKFDEGKGHAIILRPPTHTMFVGKTSSNKIYSTGQYICERNTNSVDGPRNSQMKQKSCSAGSDWTCRNEVTGCYCHQTIERNWADASSACKSIGMNLVSIETAAEQLLVASGLPKFDGGTTWWWTSGLEASGVWTWTATGGAMNYTNWAVDEPIKADNSAQAVGMRFEDDITPFWFVYPFRIKLSPLCEK